MVNFDPAGNGIPPNDRLMTKLIRDHSVEFEGRYVVKKDEAIKIVKPYVEKSLGLKGEALSRYMAVDVEELWAHTDVLRQGHIDAEWMGGFIKKACKDHTLQLH